MRLKQHKWFCILIAVALIFLIGQPAHAANDAVATVTIEECFCLEYVPKDVNNPDVDFIITLDDMIEESVSIVNHGDINWCSNVPNWKVTVYMDPWTVLSGSGDFGWYLKVKWGPPDNDSWLGKTVPIYPDTPLDWYKSWEEIENPLDRVGMGTIEGIDWKIKDLLWESTPVGSYETTVYFTIVAQ